MTICVLYESLLFMLKVPPVGTLNIEQTQLMQKRFSFCCVVAPLAKHVLWDHPACCGSWTGKTRTEGGVWLDDEAHSTVPYSWSFSCLLFYTVSYSAVTRLTSSSALTYTLNNAQSCSVPVCMINSLSGPNREATLRDPCYAVYPILYFLLHISCFINKPF